MTVRDIPAHIRSFAYWHYRFDLDGHQTPVSEQIANRHAQRKAYFFDPVVRLWGGSLAGKRVLDLGCNAGFWSLCALEAGCDFVVGIDAQPVNLAQAQFVFDVKGIARERYLFKRADVLDMNLDHLGEFDMVLCLGLLYHLNQPIALLDKIARVGRDLVLIDTRLSTLPGRAFELRYESRALPSMVLSAHDDLVLFPTRQAILDMAQHWGYRAIVLKPNFSNYLGAEEYKAGQRRAFVYARQTDLANLPAETKASIAMWRRITDIARWYRVDVSMRLGDLKRWLKICLTRPLRFPKPRRS